MPVRVKPVLPVYYYHDHFAEMLFFVSETYGPVLTERHRAFVETFKTLSKDAQCLLIRMINRRGRLFRHGAFRYAEIADARSALEELGNCNLVRALAEGDYVYIRNEGDGSEELFNERDDPNEFDNRARFEAAQAVKERLRAHLNELRAGQRGAAE